LRSSADVGTVKKALAVAVGCGFLILILSSVLLVANDENWRSIIPFALVVLLQTVLVGGSMKAYYSMNKEPGTCKY
jgi:hypothetical protein